MVITKCGHCGKEVERKESEFKKYQNTYCSRNCSSLARKQRKEIKCQNCGIKIEVTQWQHRNKPRKFCSHQCSNKARRGMSYTGNRTSSKSERRLQILKKAFNFDSCMVDVCRYSTTYDIHRHVDGKHGGKYEIGNMFAICPNHHAEITRKIIEVEKVNDYTLKVKE